VIWAATEAMIRQAPLHIVHGWTWPHLAPWLTAADRMIREDLAAAGERTLGQLAIAARNAGAATITSEVREGIPAKVLTDLSAEATVLVVGAGHLGPVGRAVLGSTSSTVLASASCPTFVITGHHAVPLDIAGIVVGISATPADDVVLRFAFDYARRHGLPLRALHCWQPGRTLLRPEPFAGRATSWITDLVAVWRESYPDVTAHAAAREAHPVSGLIEAAGRDDLVVVGRRAHPHALGTHIGSVGLGVLHHSLAPVAVVPS
jgi:nucleotide-binding universal stress UspA family protein